MSHAGHTAYAHLVSLPGVANIFAVSQGCLYRRTLWPFLRDCSGFVRAFVDIKPWDRPFWQSLPSYLISKMPQQNPGVHAAMYRINPASNSPRALMGVGCLHSAAGGLLAQEVSQSRRLHLLHEGQLKQPRSRVILESEERLCEASGLLFFAGMARKG